MSNLIAIENIKKNGYHIFENVITSEDCNHYKQLLEDNYKEFSPKYFKPSNKSIAGLENKSSEKVVYNLHNKSMDWFKLFEHPTIIDLLDVVLKDGSYLNSEPYNVLNISARTPLKNGGEQQLHLDSNLPGGDYPLIIIVLWMLDDFKLTNGATSVIPGSHKFLGYPENGVRNENEVIVEGKAGSVLVYNGALWHGGNVNTTGESRWALVLGYGRWFIKPSYDFLKNTPISVFNQLTDTQKSLLGFNTVPPSDEFTRTRRKSDFFEIPYTN